jgi:methyl-accepting chemotaxis protein
MKSLGLKISLIVTLMIAIIITSIVLIVTSRTETLVSELTGAEAKNANGALAIALQGYQDEAQTYANMISQAPDVLNAITGQNSDSLLAALKLLGSGLDSATVVGPDGGVLASLSADPAKDVQMAQSEIGSTLDSGQGSGGLVGYDGGLYTRSYAAIKNSSGDIVGAVVCGHDLSQNKYVDEIKATSNCEVTLFAGDTRLNTTLVNDSGQRVVGTKAGDAVIAAVLEQGRDYDMQTTLFGSEYAVYYSPLAAGGETLGMLFAGVNIDSTLANQRQMVTWVVSVAVGAGIAAAVILILLSMLSVSRPLKKLGLFADKLKTGELGISETSESATGVRSKDEVGRMARSLEEAYQRLHGYIGEIVERMVGIAGGDFSQECAYEFHGDFVLIGNAVNDIIQCLNDALTQVSGASEQVSLSSGQLAGGAQALAQGSTQQAATVQELSASTTEVADKTKANAQMAEKAAALANTIKQNAEKGSRQMDDMMIAVNEITQASQSIGKVIKVIDDIAFQTNILALNAAVEAARAGQHGKGFAVVAEEVRNLAAKSAEAANDTGSLIANSIEKAGVGAKIANETAASLVEIVSGINESSRIVEEIAASSEVQSADISQITNGIDQVAQVVQQNSATAEQSAAASQELNGQSAMLKELIAQFKLKDQASSAPSSATGFAMSN